MPIEAISIHQNGSDPSYEWVIKDYIENQLTFSVENEIKFHYQHTQLPLRHPFYHEPALRWLVENHICTLYMKADHDDIFYNDHVETLATALDWGSESCHYDAVVSRNAEVLVQMRYGDYIYRPKKDFGLWNPLGGMSDACMFNHKVAEALLNEMVSCPLGEPDDLCLQRVLQHFRVLYLDIKPTSCYVSHGKNDSTKDWAVVCPPEVLKED